jgi:polyisoprenoid-binding protein YceI
MSDTTTTTLTRSFEGTEVPEAGTYSVDASHSEIGFFVKHMMVSKVRGRFTDFDGSITIADDPLQSSIEVNVRLDSVDTRDEKRDEHLRSNDFFDTESNKFMTFKSTGVRHTEGNEYVVVGDLNLLGVTKSIELVVDFEGSAKDPWGGNRIGFSARGELNREDFGVTYNAALETGGVLVGKKVTLELEVEAARN